MTQKTNLENEMLYCPICGRLECEPYYDDGLWAVECNFCGYRTDAYYSSEAEIAHHMMTVAGLF